MDQKIIDAVRFYWDSRNSQKDKQVKSGAPDMGARAAVTGGAQMDKFADLVRNSDHRIWNTREVYF